MKIIYVFLLIFISNNIFAQNVSITYFSKITKKDGTIKIQNFYSLLLKNKESVYFSHVGDSATTSQYKTNYVEKQEESQIQQTGDGKYVKPAIKKYEVFYKNYLKDSISYKETPIAKNSQHIVGEKISTLFNWKIIPKSDSMILGYKCQKATTEFRGRKYIAYFNNQIAQMGGPWKFDGLPGVILYVRSEDDFLTIEPQKIEINKDTQKIDDFYVKNEKVSWQTYKKDFNDWLVLANKRLQSMSTGKSRSKVMLGERIEKLDVE